MDWITDDIAIGNYLDAQDAGALQTARIASILSLDGVLRGRSHSSLGVQEIAVHPMEDGEGNSPADFRRAVQTLLRLVNDHPPVLVQCHAGRSRSAVVVAGYLMLRLGLDPEAALTKVAEKREIAVTKGLERLLDSIA